MEGQFHGGVEAGDEGGVLVRDGQLPCRARGQGEQRALRRTVVVSVPSPARLLEPPGVGEARRAAGLALPPPLRRLPGPHALISGTPKPLPAWPDSTPASMLPTAKARPGPRWPTTKIPTTTFPHRPPGASAHPTDQPRTNGWRAIQASSPPPTTPRTPPPANRRGTHQTRTSLPSSA